VNGRGRTFQIDGRALSAIRRFRNHPGLLGQGARYVLTGCVITAFYLTLTTFMALVVGLPFQVALAIGFSVSLMAHFTLQRYFVWADREQYKLPFHHQAGRYLIASGAQYGLTAASTSFLPRLLGVSSEVVYLIVVPVLALSNFLVFRYIVFQGAKTLAGPPL
jgi:putative flippase GtrA